MTPGFTGSFPVSRFPSKARAARVIESAFGLFNTAASLKHAVNYVHRVRLQYDAFFVMHRAGSGFC